MKLKVALVNRSDLNREIPRTIPSLSIACPAARNMWHARIAGHGVV